MCKICEKEFNSIKSLSSHVRNKHGIKLLEYYIKYENFDIPKCGYCLNECKSKGGIKFTKTCGTDECINKEKRGRKVSKETKNKISKSRKKYLMENKHKHVWRRKNKFISVPCEHLKSILNNKNINFIEEYQPLEDRFFSIDIAFPKKKIGIEINGNQHYNKNGELKKYYKNRHDLIESKGWKLYELHYKIPYSDDIDQIVGKIVGKNNIDYNFDYSEYLKKELEKKINKCVDCHKKISKYSKRCNRCDGISKTILDVRNFCKCGGSKYKTSKTCMKCYHNNIEKKITEKLSDIELGEYLKVKRDGKRCKKCNTECTGNMCINCKSKENRKVERPPYDQLMEELESSTFVGVGKKYGVSDNAIRKWVKFYQKYDHISDGNN